MDVSSEFNYNAPQYREFDYPSELDDSQYGDKFFEVNDEVITYQEEIIVKTENSEETSDGYDDAENGYSPQEEYVEDHEEFTYVEEDKENETMPLRRSMSVGSLNLLKSESEASVKNMQKMQENVCEALRVIELSAKKTKSRPTEVLSSKPIFSNEKNKGRAIIRKPSSLHNSKESLNKTHNTSSTADYFLKRKTSVEDLGPKKYMSTAEYVNKFQFRTPDRFHSKPKNTALQHIAKQIMTSTIPKSPMLSTKSRIRPVYCKSHDELEKEQMEEIKKNKIKAQPMNYKIFQNAPPKVKIEKKEPTLPEPFNITDYKIKKEPVHHQPIIKQNIVPKPGINLKLKQVIKQEKIPRIIENENGKVTIQKVEGYMNGVRMSKSFKPTTTKTELFSSQFEKRYEEFLTEKEKKKEERLKQVMEEEKKQRQFHANPIPKVLGGGGPVQSRLNSSRASRSNDSINHGDEPKFKARPASVVHKKPFVPKKMDHQLSICEFELNTQKRAKEREEYDKLLKEREEEIELMKKMYKEEQEKQEAAKISQERKQRVHKANPIRHYKPVEKVISQQVTSPHSPAFHKLSAQRRNETR